MSNGMDYIGDEGDSTNSWHLFTSGDMVQECPTAKDPVFSEDSNNVYSYGREKAEARSLKQEAEKPLKQILACEDRLVSMDASLKECMQQLRFAREEQEKRIYDAIRKSREYEEHPLSCYIL
ncbi:filament-like plant protein 7 isoform X3 [Daucus carota subsp. sativus]|uniref:filament-like plant protein 7 isoform X3 n=1 Tax=Daucus carota subsp. sativus TaxID=79200 RepID=UPI003083616B